MVSSPIKVSERLASGGRHKSIKSLSTTSTDPAIMVHQEEMKSKTEGKLVDLKLPFPWKLHKLLEDTEKNNTTDVISWLSDGTSFKVHKPKVFTEEIMSYYFSQTKFNSFRRQCYIYGFRLRRDGAFFHPEFRRDNLEGSLNLRRNQQEDRRKKNMGKRALKKKPQHESNTFKLPPAPSFIGALNAPSEMAVCRTRKAALSLFDRTFSPAEERVVYEDPIEVISTLAEDIFENSQFNTHDFDEFLSLDGTFNDVPLDSLDEVFLSEIGENRCEQRYKGYTGPLIQL